MKKLKLSDWANVAEIVASFVIVASLVYVGFELRQNTKALQNEVHQNVLSILANSQNALVTNEDFHRIFVLGENSPSKLSDVEWARFGEFMWPRFGVWEYLFLAKEENAITDSVWSAYEPYYLNIICKPGYRRWWEENRKGHNQDFSTYVDSEVLPNCQDQ